MEAQAPVPVSDSLPPWEGRADPRLELADEDLRFSQLSISPQSPRGDFHAGWNAENPGLDRHGDLREPPLFPEAPGAQSELLASNANEEDGAGTSYGGRLYAQSSMVARLAEMDKNFVDPKDVPKLLPQQLLDSKSLDLAGILDSMEQNNELPPFTGPTTTPGEGPQSSQACPLPSSNPEVSVGDVAARVLHRSSVTSGGDSKAPLTSRKPPPGPPGGLRSHGRSSSEPLYPAQALAAVPVLALVPATLPAGSSTFPQLWTGQHDSGSSEGRQNRKNGRSRGNRGGSGSGSGSSINSVEGSNERGKTGPESPGSARNDAPKAANKSRRKNNKKAGKTGDVADSQVATSHKHGSGGSGGKGAKNNSNGKTKTRKSVSKGEVKRLVRYQVWVGRPIRTPWYRDKPRGMKREEVEDSETEGSNNGSGPRTPKTPTPRENSKTPRPVTESAATSPVASARGVSGTSGACPSSPDVKGTGFFCPRAMAASRK